MILDDLDKDFIKRIIELDNTNDVVMLTSVIRGKILNANILIDPFSDCVYLRKKTNIEPILNVDEVHKLSKALLRVVLLIEYLEKQGYIILAGESSINKIGELGLDEKPHIKATIEYAELRDKLQRIINKDIVPLKSLREYVENDFRSIERVEIDTQIKSIRSTLRHHRITFKQNAQSIKWTKYAVYIAAIGLILSAVFSFLSYKKTNEFLLQKDSILKIQSIQDPVKVSIPMLEPTIDSIVSKKLLEKARKDSLISLKGLNKKSVAK